MQVAATNQQTELDGIQKKTKARDRLLMAVPHMLMFWLMTAQQCKTWCWRHPFVARTTWKAALSTLPGVYISVCGQIFASLLQNS